MLDRRDGARRMTFVGFLCIDRVEKGDKVSLEEDALCLCGEGVVEGDEPGDGEWRSVGGRGTDCVLGVMVG